MPRYSVAEAKNTLPRLIDRALAGEEVIITRHGTPVVEVKARTRVDAAKGQALHDRIVAHRKAMPPTGVNSVDLLREMYDDTPW